MCTQWWWKKMKGFCRIMHAQALCPPVWISCPWDPLSPPGPATLNWSDFYFSVWPSLSCLHNVVRHIYTHTYTHTHRNNKKKEEKVQNYTQRGKKEHYQLSPCVYTEWEGMLITSTRRNRSSAEKRDIHGIKARAAKWQAKKSDILELINREEILGSDFNHKI